MKSSDYIKTTSKSYALYVAQNRAIPKISDGLKDGQRKFLWLMKSKSDKIKTVSLSGLSISENLFLHGDSSASDTISLMSAPYCNNIPYLKGIGNFGTRVTPSEFGAPRYTYVKKYNATDSLIYNDLDIVPLKENYDGSNVEPVNFLPLVPLVLLNGVSGIAVGWSTDILPRNLGSIIDATIKAVEGKKVNKITPSYDYLDCDVKNHQDNTWIFSGKIDKINTTTLRITELPPDMSLEKYKEKLNKMEDEGTIVDYEDNSAEFINIDVKVQRKIIDGKSIDDLLDMFKLRTKKTERIVVLDFNNTSIKQYDNEVDLIKDFVKWRFGWYKVRYEKMKSDDENRLRFQRALKLCFDKKLPSKLSVLSNKKEIENEVTKICNKLDLDQNDLDKISTLPSYRWSKESYSEILERIKSLEISIQEYEDIINDEGKMKSIYIKELKELKTKKFVTE